MCASGKRMGKNVSESCTCQMNRARTIGCMTDTRNEYVLGTDAAELTRLGLQHRLWGDAAHAMWRRARLRPGAQVLDVGCGPGYAGLDMAMIVGPSGRVVGVDESLDFVEHANAQAVARNLPQFHALQGDVQSLTSVLGSDEPVFEIAYARWVLCFVHSPERVVRDVHRLLRPGGRFIIQDYFNYAGMRLTPTRPAFDRLRDAAAQSWKASGGDPDVMGRMPGLLREHGFEMTYLDVDQRIARPCNQMWDWPDSFWTTFAPRLVEGGFLTEAECVEFFEQWHDAANDPDTFFALPQVYEIIATRR